MTVSNQAKKLQFSSKQAGFNLIELLVVISIIALIVSAALLLLNSSRQKSRDAKRVADIKQIISALDLYYSRCNSYPNPSVYPLTLDSTQALFTGNGGVLGPCGTNGGTGGANGGIGAVASTSGTVIIRQFVAAPNPPDGGCGANNSYQYTPTNAGANYTLTFCLGQATGGYPLGPNTVSR